jgi:hypothetical protein
MGINDGIEEPGYSAMLGGNYSEATTTITRNLYSFISNVEVQPNI